LLTGMVGVDDRRGQALSAQGRAGGLGHGVLAAIILATLPVAELGLLWPLQKVMQSENRRCRCRIRVKKHSKTQMEVLLGSGRAVHVRGMGWASLAKEGHTSTSHIPVYIQNMLFPVFL
jgi:hypothetical protein